MDMLHYLAQEEQEEQEAEKPPSRRPRPARPWRVAVIANVKGETALPADAPPDAGAEFDRRETIQAIQDAIGRSAFSKRNLPRAVMMLKQGVGRLIRTETDRGIVVLLDPRFRTKPYGRDILAALPGSPELDVTTLNPDCLPLVGHFIDGLYRVA